AEGAFDGTARGALHLSRVEIALSGAVLAAAAAAALAFSHARLPTFSTPVAATEERAAPPAPAASPPRTESASQRVALESHTHDGSGGAGAGGGGTGGG